MERADRDFLIRAFRDERLHFILRVVGVGDRHRGLCKAKAPARRQSGAAGELEEFSGYVGNLGAREDVIVEIAARRLVRPVGTGELSCSQPRSNVAAAMSS